MLLIVPSVDWTYQRKESVSLKIISIRTSQTDMQRERIAIKKNRIFKNYETISGSITHIGILKGEERVNRAEEIFVQKWP
jgi:hypothetical protein